MNKNRKGFTLIEMLVVIGIIGILSAMLLVSVGRIRKSSIDTRRKANLENIRGAITMYYSVKSTWPTFVAWDDLIQSLSSSGYLSDLIKSDEDSDGQKDYSACLCGANCNCSPGSQIKISSRFEVSSNEDCAANSTCSADIGTGENTCCSLEVK